MLVRRERCWTPDDYASAMKDKVISESLVISQTAEASVDILDERN